MGSDARAELDLKIWGEITIVDAAQQQIKKFNVQVKRISQQQAVAETHGDKITLAIQGKDSNLGFTAPGAVLAAFGACILSNVTKGATEMGLQIDEVGIEFSAFKRLQPLGYEDLRYTLIIQSSESTEKLQALYEHAVTDGTATNALLEGLKPQGRLLIYPKETRTSSNESESTSQRAWG